MWPRRGSVAPQSEGRFDVSVFANYMRMDAGFPQRGFAPDGRLERVRGQFNYLAAGAMLTIPVLNRNQGEVAVARAEWTGAAAAHDAARLAAEAELASARARDERARQAVTALQPTARKCSRARTWPWSVRVTSSGESQSLTFWPNGGDTSMWNARIRKPCAQRTRRERRSIERSEKYDDE